MSLRYAIAAFAVWTTLCLLSAGQAVLALQARGHPAPVDALLLEAAIEWYSCALFTPAVVWLVRRYPLRPGRRTAHLALWLGAIAVMTTGKYAIETAAWRAVGRAAAGFTDALQRGFIRECIAFAAVFAAVYAVELWISVRERERREHELRVRLTDARLEALARQIQPHFLFNTLQAVSTLLHRDPQAADQMVTRLSQLLRATLRTDGRHEVSLAEELDLARAYLAIMTVRFAGHLGVTWSVSAELERSLVPRFILQPVIENAVQHGVSRHGGGTIEIAAGQAVGALVLTVRDDAPDARDPTSEGIGLQNTRERLRELYGTAAGLAVRALPDRGFEVNLSLPLRFAS
jgi:two-component system, LytTR family, sensor kinase